MLFAPFSLLCLTDCHRMIFGVCLRKMFGVSKMSKKIIDNWLSLAKYDLATAQDMLKAKRYLYVAFMCQQAIEKILKACYVKQHTSTPPYTHNLLRLIKDLSFKDEMGEESLATQRTSRNYQRF